MRRRNPKAVMEDRRETAWFSGKTTPLSGILNGPARYDVAVSDPEPGPAPSTSLPL